MDDQLTAVAAQLGACPDCGGEAVRLASYYPAEDGSAQATVACDEGHVWEGQVPATTEAVAAPEAAQPEPEVV